MTGRIILRVDDAESAANALADALKNAEADLFNVAVEPIEPPQHRWWQSQDGRVLRHRPDYSHRPSAWSIGYSDNKVYIHIVLPEPKIDVLQRSILHGRLREVAVHDDQRHRRYCERLYRAIYDATGQQPQDYVEADIDV